MEKIVYSCVWYRQTQKNDLFPKAMQDVGTLTINQDHIEFRSKKLYLDIPVQDVRRVHLGKQGNDWINNWTIVEYGSNCMAYFADGRLLGWRGLLGGTSAIWRTLSGFCFNAA